MIYFLLAGTRHPPFLLATPGRVLRPGRPDHACGPAHAPPAHATLPPDPELHSPPEAPWPARHSWDWAGFFAGLAPCPASF